MGLEDDRGTTGWLTHKALLVEANIEYKGLGLVNSLYLGDAQMSFYPQEGNHLYWGDPIYRTTNYNRTDFYIKFFESENVKTKFMYSFHAAEGNVYHEQALYVSINMNNYPKKSEPKYKYIWDNWFK
jgi:hypothetical protein